MLRDLQHCGIGTRCCGAVVPPQQLHHPHRTQKGRASKPCAMTGQRGAVVAASCAGLMAALHRPWQQPLTRRASVDDLRASASRKVETWRRDFKTGDEMASPTDGVKSLWTKIESTLTFLEQGLVQREQEARILLLAMFCGEHVLMLGPPGTAKSLLAGRLASLCGSGVLYFERLLTRFSVPEELFGPLSLKALERDEYLRRTEGFMPEATIAFIDEIFKANSAILNTLLTLLNERVFDNGCARVPVPLQCLVGASNEPPESEELEALFDRFLFRLSVAPVTDDAFADLIAATTTAQSGTVADSGQMLSLEEMADSREAARAVVIPLEVVALLRDARSLMRAQEPPVAVSDRRLGQAARMLQVTASTCGRNEVSKLDCFLLLHVFPRSSLDKEAMDKMLRRSVLKSKREQIAYVLEGLLDRARSGATDIQMLAKECEAMRRVLLKEAGRVEQLQECLASHRWLPSYDVADYSDYLDAELNAPGRGLLALLLQVASMEAACEAGDASVAAYLEWRKQESVVEGEAGELLDAADMDEEFTVGKHRGQLFSQVAQSDEDYCRMLEAKYREGRFAGDAPLDQQVRKFVAYLKALGVRRGL